MRVVSATGFGRSSLQLQFTDVLTDGDLGFRTESDCLTSLISLNPSLIFYGCHSYVLQNCALPPDTWRQRSHLTYNTIPLDTIPTFAPPTSLFQTLAPEEDSALRELVFCWEEGLPFSLPLHTNTHRCVHFLFLLPSILSLKWESNIDSAKFDKQPVAWECKMGLKCNTKC